MNVSQPSGPAAAWFVTFEGIEGSGKSTQILHLADRLRAERPGQPVLQSSIDGRLQRRLEALTTRHQRHLGDGGLTLAVEVMPSQS